MKQLLSLIILTLLYSPVWADEYIDEENNPKKTIFDIQAQEKKASFDAMVDEARNYSILNNKLFENDKIRIYNNTLYEYDASGSKLMTNNIENLMQKDLKLSLGYGMEFKISKDRKVGYEYVSDFPYNRGQLIRIFWSKRF